MGVGSFEFTGEGFCYFNWHDKALATLMLLVTLPTMVASVTFLALTLKRSGWPSQLDLILMLFGFSPPGSYGCQQASSACPARRSQRGT